MPARVRMACEPTIVIVPLERIVPSRTISPATKKTAKYKCIEASIQELGLIEPLIIHPLRKDAMQYRLLDGNIRYTILKDLGQTGAKCLVSTDDEAFTYNHKVNRIGAIQEHFMIMKAIKNGVSEDRIARTLSIDVARIKQKRDLLEGVCPEAVELLKDKHVPAKMIVELRKVKPMKQIEIAEQACLMHTFTAGFVRCQIAVSPAEELVESDTNKDTNGLSAEDIERLEHELETVASEFKMIEESHGTNTLNLVVVTGYLKRLLDNSRVVRFLSQHYRELLLEFQKIVDAKQLGEEPRNA